MEDLYTSDDFSYTPPDIEIVTDNFEYPELMVGSLKSLFKDGWKAKLISWKSEFTSDEWTKVQKVLEQFG